MANFDVAIIGAGLGGLTTGAILARAGRKVFVIERSNSVGGAASSYKVGDLFVEGSLHETSDPHDPRDPKHLYIAVSIGGIFESTDAGVDWMPLNEGVAADFLPDPSVPFGHDPHCVALHPL